MDTSKREDELLRSSEAIRLIRAAKRKTAVDEDGNVYALEVREDFSVGCKRVSGMKRGELCAYLSQ